MNHGVLMRLRPLIAVLFVGAGLLIAPLFMHGSPVAAQTSTTITATVAVPTVNLTATVLPTIGLTATVAPTVGLTATALPTVGLTATVAPTLAPTTTATAAPTAAVTGTATAVAAATSTATAVPVVVSPATVSTFLICGQITAYTAPAATAGGSVTLAGLTFPLAAGASLTGTPSLLVAGNNVCLIVTTSSTGTIATGIVAATASSSPSVQVCGPVTAFTTATATGNGTITINGFTFSLGAAGIFTGTAPTVGSSVCISGALGTGGVITGGAFTSLVPTAANLADTDAGLVKVGHEYAG